MFLSLTFAKSQFIETKKQDSNLKSYYDDVYTSSSDYQYKKAETKVDTNNFVNYTDLNKKDNKKNENIEIDTTLTKKSVITTKSYNYKKIKFTFAYVGGVNREPISPMGLFLSIGNKYSFFSEIKFGVYGINKYSESELSEVGVYTDNWSNETIINDITNIYEAYPGSYQNGSYTEYHSKTMKSTGSLKIVKNMINFGIAKNLLYDDNDDSFNINLFIGLGLTIYENYTIERIHTQWYEYTWYNALQSSYYSGLNDNSSYYPIKNKNTFELNMNAGLSVNIGAYYTGISFDLNPFAFNASVGFTISSKK